MHNVIQNYKLVLVSLVLVFLALPSVRGQGFIYLSNTNQNVADNSSAGNSFGIGFTTGSNASGYLLNSITVLFADNNTPVLTSAGLDNYSTITYFQSAVQVGTAGYYTFTPNSPLTLTANTPYAILFFAADAFANINLSYTTSSSIASVDNWNVPGLGESEIPLFAITATPVAPVPEPSVIYFASGGIFAFIALQIKRRGLNQKAKF
jgi:drug/metabolite transporter superfamily protein YnfA